MFFMSTDKLDKKGIPRLQCLSTWPHYFLPLGLLLSLPLQTSYLLQPNRFLYLQHTLRKKTINEAHYSGNVFPLHEREQLFYNI